MYSQHFHLHSEPFSLSPDPAFLYASPDHAEALAALRIALQSRRGLTTLTGEVGTGKTTLLYALLSDLGPTVHTAYLANTRLSFDELLQQALADFGVAVPGGDRLAALDALHGFLRRCDAAGELAALVVDEAQNLDADTFEQLRLLTNFETYSAKLLQIVLVGQPELAEALRRPALRQVDERVAFRCHIRPLSRRECRRYLAHRLARAGGSLALFSPAALALLIGAARGLPRRLNVLAHTALLFAYGRNAPRVSARFVAAALRERRRARAAHRVGPRRRAAVWAAGAGLLAAAGVATALGRSAPAAGPPAAVEPPAVVVDAGCSSELVELCQLGSTSPVASAPPPAVVARAAPAPVPEGPLVVVAPGMTLTDIARRFYGDARPATLRRLKAANPSLRDADRITAGDVLRVPGAVPGRRAQQGGNG